MHHLPRSELRRLGDLYFIYRYQNLDAYLITVYNTCYEVAYNPIDVPRTFSGDLYK